MIIGYSGKIQGLFWPFWSPADTIRYRLIWHESARFSMNRPESEPHRRELWKKKSTWQDMARNAGNSVPCASLCRAASDAGAAPLVLCSCFPGPQLKTGCFAADEDDFQYGPWLRSMPPQGGRKKDAGIPHSMAWDVDDEDVLSVSEEPEES